MEWLRHPWAKLNIKTSPDYVDRTSHYENRAHALSWRSLVKIICFHRSFSIRFKDSDSSLSIVRGRAQQCNSSHDVSNSALKQGKFSKSHSLNYCQWGDEWVESNRIPMLCPKNSGIPRGRGGKDRKSLEGNVLSQARKFIGKFCHIFHSYSNKLTFSTCNIVQIHLW